MSATTARTPAPPSRTSSPPAARAPRPGLRVLVLLLGHGLREHRRTPLVWGGLLGATSAMMVAIWPSISGSLGRVAQSYPEALREAFGIVRLDSVEAYLDAEMLSLVVPAAIAVLAVRIITAPTVGAEDRGELDTVMALPIGRRTLVWASFLTTAVVVAGTLVLVWAVTVAVGRVAGTGISVGVVGRGLANVWPLAMASAGVAALAAGAHRGAGRAVGIAAGVLLAMYVLDLVARVAPGMEGLRDLSAFRYYGSAVRDGLDPGHVVVLTAAALALTAAGSELFARRDLS